VTAPDRGNTSTRPLLPASGPPPTSWLDERLRGRLRHSPRLSRLVTSIDLFGPELAARQERCDGSPMPNARSWPVIADEHLQAARQAVNERRLDDGWDLLHSAQRQAMNALTRSEAADTAVALERECAAKLVGWRREAAAASVEDVKAALGPTPAGNYSAGPDENTVLPPGDPAALAPADVCATLIHIQRLVDENSNNAYLRLRLVGQRLLLATVLLAALLVVLGCLVAGGALSATAFDKVTVLHEVGTYATIALLGMLGALLSFSIGAMASGANRRIYELASGRFAATLARILVGAAAAIVITIAVQSGVVALNNEWLLILAVAAGFSERLVKRIIESLSADAEKPQEPVKPPDGQAPNQPGS
jgi:hypothetical protein